GNVPPGGGGDHRDRRPVLVHDALGRLLARVLDADPRHGLDFAAWVQFCAGLEGYREPPPPPASKEPRRWRARAKSGGALTFNGHIPRLEEKKTLVRG